MDGPLYLSRFDIDSITCHGRDEWQLLGWLKFILLHLEVNSLRFSCSNSEFTEPEWLLVSPPCEWFWMKGKLCSMFTIAPVFPPSFLCFDIFLYKTGHFVALVLVICVCSCVACFAIPLPASVVLLLPLRIVISPSCCATPGLHYEQIAALFISLVINITRCTATFAGNNTDNAPQY